MLDKPTQSEGKCQLWNFPNDHTVAIIQGIIGHGGSSGYKALLDLPSAHSLCWEKQNHKSTGCPTRQFSTDNDKKRKQVLLVLGTP